MKQFLTAALAVVITCLLSLPAQAAIINYTSFLTAAPGSDAEGGAGIIFQYNDTTNSLSWTVGFNSVGLTTGGITAAHFHSGSQTGDIEIDLFTGVNSDDTGLNANITLAPSIGDVMGTFQGVGTLSTAQVDALLAGNMYVNIHSDNSVYPSGELYGQILKAQAVPVPAAVWLFGSGLLGLVGVARRKARPHL